MAVLDLIKFYYNIDRIEKLVNLDLSEYVERTFYVETEEAYSCMFKVLKIKDNLRTAYSIMSNRIKRLNKEEKLRLRHYLEIGENVREERHFNFIFRKEIEVLQENKKVMKYIYMYVHSKRRV